MLKFWRRKQYMDEAGRKALGELGKEYLKRYEKFDDRAIGAAWVKIAEHEPSVRVTTAKGLTLTAKRNVTGRMKVAYEAFLDEHPDERVAWMHCSMPIAECLWVRRWSRHTR